MKKAKTLVENHIIYKLPDHPKRQSDITCFITEGAHTVVTDAQYSVALNDRMAGWCLLWEGLKRIMKSDIEEYEHHSENEPTNILEKEDEKPNFTIVYVILVAIVAIFFFKLLNLQVVQGTKYQYLAEGNRIRTRDIAAPRGIVYDADGEMLAKNTAKFELVIYPAELPEDKDGRLAIYQKIQSLIIIIELMVILKFKPLLTTHFTGIFLSRK